ncbi:MAG: thioredoxin domain-containing protein, partial [Phycisphaerae bacterium]
CKMLDRSTWKDERVIKLLQDKTVALKIDAEQQRELAQKYGVSGYPTLMFFKADGTKIGSLVGYYDGPGFLKEAEDLVKGITPLDRLKMQIEESPEDPMLRHQLGNALAQEGKFEEALKEFLWCLDEGAKKNPDYAGIRGAYLIPGIYQLGSVHPPARAALEERRTAAEKAVRAGESEYWVVTDVVAINRAFEEQDRVLKIYDELLPKQNTPKETLATLRGALFETLLKAKRYEELVRDELPAQFEIAIANLQQLEKQYQNNPRSPVAFAKRQALHEGAQFTEAAAGAGNVDDALLLAKRTLDLESSTATHQMLRQAAERAGNAEFHDKLTALLNETPKSS